MEESKKKVIMVVVIGACLVAAGIITYSTQSARSGSIESIKEGEEMYWLKCRNPDCEHAWQMDRRKYLDYQKEQVNAKGFGIYPISCPKCGEESGYRAIKCTKCGAIFEPGAVPDDIRDRCPECGYSEAEIKDKARRGR